MLLLISPAKTLDFNSNWTSYNFSLPVFSSQAEILMQELRTLKLQELQELLQINRKLALLNFERNLAWHIPHTIENAKPSLLVFKGEVFRGINAESYTEEHLNFAQEHLRILSGLYGILKPLDLIQPYRLEMGIKLKTKRFIDLYDFWNNKINDNIDAQLKKLNTRTIVNLASAEYFKATKLDTFKYDIITPVFLEKRNGLSQIITIYMKKARGLMTSFIIKNKIINPEEIKLFNNEGYTYNNKLSEWKNWVFIR